MSDWRCTAARVSAPAKLNLSLHIVGRRDDGYHLLDSITTPVTLFDDVDVRVSPSATGTVEIHCEPAGAAPAGADNLAARAAALFMQRTRRAARVSIALRKRIPAGAGMGGGSSDAAGVLRALNALAPEPVERADLATYALALGADVPLFLFGRPARMRGVGEILEPWPPAVPWPIVVAFPGTGLDTRAVYARYDDLLTRRTPASTIPAPAPGQEPLRKMLHNDLEAAAFHLQPALRSVKERLRALGAEGVLMTGSGSALFGLWKRWDDARAAADQLRSAGTWARVVRGLDRVPAVELVTE